MTDYCVCSSVRLAKTVTCRRSRTFARALSKAACAWKSPSACSTRSRGSWSMSYSGRAYPRSFRSLGCSIDQLPNSSSNATSSPYCSVRSMHSYFLRSVQSSHDASLTSLQSLRDPCAAASAAYAMNRQASIGSTRLTLQSAIKRTNWSTWRSTGCTSYSFPTSWC